MACKDRQNDTNIITTIAKRNILANANLDTTASNSTENFHIVDIQWTGNLFDVQMYVNDIDNLVSITQISPGVFIASYAQKNVL